MILGYVLAQDQDEEAERLAIEYKNNLFAHAFMSGNQELFVKLFPQDFGMDPKDEMWLDVELPNGNVRSVEDMMAELRATGWRG